MSNITRRAVRKFRRGIKKSIDHCDRVVSGFYRLDSQKELLETNDWSVIILLDACRADYFDRIRSGARPVRSLGRETSDWVQAFSEMARSWGKELLWVTANPVVDDELAAFGSRTGLITLRVWESDWDYHTEMKIPSVHPSRVNRAVEEYVKEHGQPERMIVHYLQPHSPYIGDFPLAVAVWGWMPDDFSKEASDLPAPDEAIERRAIGWSELRRAYRENLKLVMPYVEDLCARLDGKVVITADHGELLGELGRFGHHPQWPSRVLETVPWLELENGEFSPSPVFRGETEGPAQDVLERRLRSLGYL